MTRIKICGITCLEDAQAAVAAGADALGFVFAPSPRQVAPALVREIVRALPPFVRGVGVFVDAPPEQVLAICAETRLDVVQLHGAEPPEYGARLPQAVIQRLPVEPGDDRERLRSRLARYPDVQAWLLDPGAGSGRSFPWDLCRDLAGRPLIVAGGLVPENVARAVRVARPYGVDVSSGVESAAGRKDPRRLRAFVAAVRGEDARRPT